MNALMQNVVFIAAMIGIFYFLLIRPQQNRAKAHRELLATLEPGATIVTVGGIFGTVVEVGDRVRIKVYDGSEIEVARAGIGSVVKVEEPDLPEDETPIEA